MRVGVAGLGAIGGALAGALGAAGCDPTVPGTPTVAELAAECELVIVAVPPSATVAVAREALGAGALVADTASVKRPVAEAVHDPRFLGAHPLAGPQDLHGAPWALCPHGDEPPDVMVALAEALAPLEPSFVVTSAAEHDAAVARTSHLPHLVAHALARLAAPHAALSGGALRDMTRVVAGGEELWREILELNRDEIEAAMAELELGGLGGAQAREEIERARWYAPEWEPAQAGWPAWDALRDAVFRRPRLTDGQLGFEKAARRERRSASSTAPE